MKLAIITAALLSIAAPAVAQEAMPLLRVYVDTPYFYEIMLTGNEMSETGRRLKLVVEGKEVGASTIEYDCVNGQYSESVTTPWTGSANAYIPAALMAYNNLFC